MADPACPASEPDEAQGPGAEAGPASGAAKSERPPRTQPPASLTDKRYLLLLGFAVLFLAAALSHQGLARADRFGYGSPDDALFVQHLWNTTQGRPWVFTLERWEPPWEVSTLGAHFDLSSAVYLPGALLAPGHTAPMLLQPLLVLLGAFPLYFFALRRLQRPGMALTVACLYLAHPLLMSNCIRLGAYFQLTPPLLLFALERWDRGRLRAAAALFALALMTREEVGLSVCAFLIPLAILDKTKRRASLLIAAGCLLWFLLYTGALKGHVFGPGPNMIAGRYSYLGSSIPAILLSPIVHPLTFFGHLVRSEGSLVGLLVLLPVLPALLFAPRHLLAALVPVVGVALSSKGSDHVLGKYLIPSIPFMYAGLVVGLARIREWSEPRRVGDLRTLTLALACGITLCALAADVGFFKRYKPLRCLDPLDLQTLEAMTPEHRELLALLEKVPPEASVSASPLTWLHLAPRRFLHPFPVRAREVDMLVVDTSPRPPRWPPSSNAQHDAQVRAALEEPGIRVTRAGYYVLIDRRKLPYAPSARQGTTPGPTRPR